MKLLLDQGLPRSSVPYLKKIGIEATHVGEIGLAAASDQEILSFAEQNDCTVVTLDADFHALLAKSASSKPSVIRIRIEGLRAEALTTLLRTVMELCNQDVADGAVVSVTEKTVRVRRLPLVR